MKFYTKKWKEYIYNNYEEALPKIPKICYDIEYSEYLKDDIFYKYYDLKKKYVSSEKELKEKFVNYEKVELLSFDEEKKLFNERITAFINNRKQKDLSIIQTLKESNIDINLDINDIDYNLLSLNIMNTKTNNFYNKLRDIYNTYLYEKLDFNEYLQRQSEINSINFGYNDVCSFLTSYSEYLKRTNKNIYYTINNIPFTETKIVRYEKQNNDLVIELVDYSNKIRLTLKDAEIQSDTEREITIDDILGINDYLYETYEDIENILTIEFTVIDELHSKLEELEEEMYDTLKVNIIAKEIKYEELNIN